VAKEYQADSTPDSSLFDRNRALAIVGQFDGRPAGNNIPVPVRLLSTAAEAKKNCCEEADARVPGTRHPEWDWQYIKMEIPGGTGAGGLDREARSASSCGLNRQRFTIFSRAEILQM